MNFLHKHTIGAIHELVDNQGKYVVLQTVAIEDEDGDEDFYRVCPICFEVDKAAPDDLILESSAFNQPYFIELWNEFPLRKSKLGSYSINIHDDLLNAHSNVQSVELDGNQIAFRKSEILEYRNIALEIFNDSKAVRRNYSYLSIAAVVVLLIASMLVLLPSIRNTSETDYLALYQAESMIADIDLQNLDADDTRSSNCIFENLDSIQCSLAISAIKFFSNQEYEQTIEKLSFLVDHPQLNYRLSLVYTYSKISVNDYDGVKAMLRSMYDSSEGDYSDEVKFYLALLYLKTDEKDKALILLHEIEPRKLDLRVNLDSLINSIEI